MAFDLHNMAIGQVTGPEAIEIAGSYLKTVGLKKVGEYTASTPATGTAHPQQPQ